MTDIVMLIWLADVVKALTNTSIFLMVVFCMATAVNVGAYFIGKMEDFSVEIYKSFIIAFVISMLLVVLLPSKNVVYMYAGAKATEQVVTELKNNPRVMGTVDKVLKLVDKKLEEAIDSGELPEKEKK